MRVSGIRAGKRAGAGEFNILVVLLGKSINTSLQPVCATLPLLRVVKVVGFGFNVFLLCLVFFYSPFLSLFHLILTTA